VDERRHFEQAGKCVSRGGRKEVAFQAIVVKGHEDKLEWQKGHQGRWGKPRGNLSHFATKTASHQVKERGYDAHITRNSHIGTWSS
jgi:hypothetical protein